MKFFIRNNFFMLLLALSCYASTHAETNPIKDAQITQEQDNATDIVEDGQFEKLLQGVLEQTKKLGSILQALADQISNHQIKLKNKQDVLQHIMLIKEQIDSLDQQAQALVDKDIKHISALLAIVTFFVKHVETLIENNLKTIPELNMDSLHKRSGLSNDSLESVANVYTLNEEALKKLEKNVNYIGLTIFNRAFRWAENLNDDYHIGSRLWKASLCGLAASTLLLLLDKDLLSYIPGHDTVIKPLKDYVGDAPQFDANNKLTTPENRLSPLGKILINFGPRGMDLINYVFAPIITWQLFGSYMKNDAVKAKNWADDNFTKILNWLRGGAARKIMRGGKKEPSVTFKDGIGFEHVKYTLYPYIEYYCRTEGWDRANIAPQTGIIFAGESRTGKTFMAEMLAGQIKQEMKARGVSQDLTFIVFNAAEVQMLGIGSILEYARSQAPCIIFIDEIDMLSLQRETNAQVLSEFLTQMSGCMEKDINKRVILIGATNKPESLDKALLQYGRFGKVIWFEYPTMQERMLFLTRECTSRAILVDPTFLEKLARETERCSYDALHNIIATAAQKARIEESAVKQYHIEAAFDEEIRQMLVKNVELPEHQQHLIALHIAGHTLATHLLDGQKNIVKATIRPVKIRVQEEPLWARFEKKKDKVDPIVYGKVFTYNKDQELSMPSHDDMVHECKTILAGHAAEKVVLGSSGYGYHRDDQKEALAIAKYIVFKGMDPLELPKSTRSELEKEAYDMVQQLEAEITQLLTDKKEQLLLLTEALEKQLTLNAEEIAMLADLSNEQITLLREEIKKLEEQFKAEMLKEAQGANKHPSHDHADKANGHDNADEHKELEATA